MKTKAKARLQFISTMTEKDFAWDTLVAQCIH